MGINYSNRIYKYHGKRRRKESDVAVRDPAIINERDVNSRGNLTPYELDILIMRR